MAWCGVPGFDRRTTMATNDDAGDQTSLTDGFSTANEYFTMDDPPEEPQDGEPPTTIVWFDQATPLFVCRVHHEEIVDLEWEGDRSVSDYESRRSHAYRQLMQGVVGCVVCEGKLKEKVGGRDD